MKKLLLIALVCLASPALAVKCPKGTEKYGQNCYKPSFAEVDNCGAKRGYVTPYNRKGYGTIISCECRYGRFKADASGKVVCTPWN